MADIVTATDVANIVAFVAPGYVAVAVYTARFDRPMPSDGSTLIMSAILSLPLVAVTNKLASGVDIAPEATDIKYVALLTTVAFLASLATATLWVQPFVRRFAGRVGLSYQPHPSLYSETLLRLPPDAAVTVFLKDGTRLSGTPKAGPGRDEGGLAALYLTHPAWWDSEAEEWTETDAGGAVIVPLTEVQSLSLDRDPTP